MKPVTRHKNQWVSFYRNEQQPDGYGGTTVEAVPYWLDTRAEVRPLRVSRTLEANQEKLQAGFEFRIRQRIDRTVLVDDILVYRGLAFTVHSVVPDLIYKEDLVIIAMETGKKFEENTT